MSEIIIKVKLNTDDESKAVTISKKMLTALDIAELDLIKDYVVTKTMVEVNMNSKDFEDQNDEEEDK